MIMFWIHSTFQVWVLYKWYGRLIHQTLFYHTKAAGDLNRQEAVWNWPARLQVWSHFYWKLSWEYQGLQEVKNFSFTFLFKGCLWLPRALLWQWTFFRPRLDFINWTTNTTPLLTGDCIIVCYLSSDTLSVKSDPVRAQGNFASGRICNILGLCSFLQSLFKCYHFFSFLERISWIFP